MESLSESNAKIIAEVTTDDPTVRGAYLRRYSAQVKEFAKGMAAAILSWRALDLGSECDVRRAYVKAAEYDKEAARRVSLALSSRRRSERVK